MRRRHDWDEIGGHHKTIIEDEIIKWIIVHLDPPVRAVFVRDHKGRGRKERKEKVTRRLRSVARGQSPRVYYKALSSCHWNLWHAVVVSACIFLSVTIACCAYIYRHYI